MSQVAVFPHDMDETWKLPSRGIVGIAWLIVAESSIFMIFVVAYIFYIGKSLSGPTPRDVLELPIFTTICLLSSSFTVMRAVSFLEKSKTKLCSLWLAITILLGAIFLAGTAREWHQLIYHDGLTIRTNLFGTTYYSLVGLHAFHVTVGLMGIVLVMIFALLGKMQPAHSDRVDVFSMYWHFVDAVWVIVFTVVYFIGR